MPVSLVAVGDLILDEPDPDSYFTLSAAALRAADVAVGHVEVPHTALSQERSSDVPAPPSDPGHLEALKTAGFDVVTLAGNHIYDAGDVGIQDTIRTLHAHGIATAGAGMTLEAARQPAVVERRGVRFGVLSYNCVGPKDAWATPKKAGCAFVHVLTHYELDHASPGGPPTIYTFANPDSLEALVADIASLRSRCDVLAVAFHKGVGHVPAHLAMYEKPVARAAIDAGADAVISHHAHILRGIDVYKGRPIFHGLGNFVTVTHALSVDTNDPQRAAWARRRKELFGFEPDPETPEYPFHPESRNTIIARLSLEGPGEVRASFLPCYINRRSQPEVLGHGERGQQVVDYVERISRAAGLNARFAWHGDEVLISAG